MPRLLTKTDQITELLRVGMMEERWRNFLPGRDRLAKELGCSHWTVEEAMQRLTKLGMLKSDGVGRRRRIILPDKNRSKRVLRVRILLHEKADRRSPESVELLGHLRRKGFAADFAMKSLLDLEMDVSRVARFVEKTPADAWIVVAGSREVLEWFAQGEVPAIAMLGRFTGVPIAAGAPRLSAAMVQAVRRLVALGHRRIVLLAGETRRKPIPGLFEQMFLDELEAHGLPTGPYNLPDWETHPQGLRDCLDALFVVTPPTAIICGEVKFFTAASQHLDRRGILAPEHVSLICSDPSPMLDWCEPKISYFSWDYGPVIQRVLRWVNNVALGKQSKRQILVDAQFVEGGTIGPAPK